MLVRNAMPKEDGAWPGRAAIIALSAWISSAFAGLVDGSHRVDLHTWLMAPLAWAVFFLSGAFVFFRASRQPWQEVMDEWIPWMIPAALAIPFLEMLRRWMGFAWNAKDAIAPREWPAALATLGAWPHPTASFGVTVVLATFALVVGCRAMPTESSASRTRFGTRITHRALRGCLAAVTLIILWSAIFSIPSAVAWMARPMGTPLLTLSSADTARASVLLSMDGYWWQNAQTRFLGGIGNEVETSAALLKSALLFLAVAAMAFGWFWKTRRHKQLFTQDVFHHAFFLFWGVAFAFLHGAKTDARFVTIVAWLVAVATAALFALAVAQREQNRGASNVFLVLCLAGAWLLGWPIFLLAAAVVALTMFESLGLPILASCFQLPASSFKLGFSTVIAASVAWLFATHQPDLSLFPIGLALALVTASAGFRASQLTGRWLPAAAGFLLAGLSLNTRTSFLFAALVALVFWFAHLRPSPRTWERPLWFYLFFAVATFFS